MVNLSEDRTLYIEVKASTGRIRNIYLSRSEFKLSLEKGADYWLCFVGNANVAIPDEPIIYKDLASLIKQNKVKLTLNKVSMTLP